MQQEPVLFSGTIRENIVYGLNLEHESHERVTEMIDEACHAANAYTFTHDPDVFPLVYDTIVGERGVKLSGG